ncbi:hypothetical protein [Brevundimonas sp.]|uniref:hypothetical protein n=1 Tax=Brevundimonas sp. TaxID=1871086 RepID=UPI002E140B7F
MVMQMSSGPEGHRVDYKPWSRCVAEKPRHQPFRIWWPTEPIFVEGIGGASADGMIPLNPEEQLGWESRLKLTRERFVTDMRNTMGAHRDQEIPTDLANLYRSAAFGGQPAAMSPDGNMLTIENGGIEVGTWPADAMLRHIAEEVLMAYGLKPNDAWDIEVADS